MAVEDIKPNARKLIADHISSVAQLELLLLLRMNPTQEWTAERLGREMRLEQTWASGQLKDLCDRGLLSQSESQPGAFRYEPRSADLNAAVEALAQAYLLHRVSVIELIHSRPPQSMRAFSDAFRLRREATDG